MHNDPPSWTVLASLAAYRSRWVGVTVDMVQLPAGQRYEYTRLEPAGVGVGVIGFNAAGEILLEREYRHGVGEVVWQIPGGLANEGEDLQRTGLRELEEETGFAPAVVTPETVRYLGTVWDNPGFGVAQSHIYLACGLVETGRHHRDQGEIVALHWVTPAWLKDAIRTGVIKDRVVVAAVAYLMLNGII
jgi:8-oxo-dGTP pyrophosphatase MutT (NUDIX family)